MTRIAKSGIDGISIQKRTLPSGTVVHRVRVRKPTGEYEDAGSFASNAEARRAGIVALRRLNEAVVAPMPEPPPAPAQPVSAPIATPPVGVHFPTLAREYAKLQRALGRSPGRAVVFDHLANSIERAGFGNLQSGTFGIDLIEWLRGLKPWWCNTNPEANGRWKNRDDLSDRYRNDLLEKVACVINYEVNKDNPRILRNPMLRKPGKKELQNFTVQKKLKPTFTIGELRAMVSSEMEADPWWLASCLLVYTGCRAQEAMFLRWEWIDWESRVIRLQYSEEEDAEPDEIADLKTGERIIPLQDELAELLRPIAHTFGFIIADEYMRTNGSIKHCKRTKAVKHEYTRRFRRYCSRCGFNPGRRTVHSLRHNYAAIHLAMGKNFNDVMDALGHQDEETTLGYAKMRALFTTAVKDWTDHQYHLRTDPPTRVSQSVATPSLQGPAYRPAP